MVKILYADDIAQRLNVSKGTLHKKEFQRRIGLPIGRIGKRISCPEPIFDDWVINKTGAGQADEKEST